MSFLSNIWRQYFVQIYFLSVSRDSFIVTIQIQFLSPTVRMSAGFELRECWMYLPVCLSPESLHIFYNFVAVFAHLPPIRL